MFLLIASREGVSSCTWLASNRGQVSEGGEEVRMLGLWRHMGGANLAFLLVLLHSADVSAALPFPLFLPVVTLLLRPQVHLPASQ